MKHRKKLMILLTLTACMVLFCSFPVFAAELTEAQVEQAVAEQGKETVTGNVFVWFLCAIAFLKVSQKIDSFMASLGINVGNTGGNMMAELLIAGRSLGNSFRGHGGGSHGRSSSPGSAARRRNFPFRWTCRSSRTSSRTLRCQCSYWIYGGTEYRKRSVSIFLRKRAETLPTM